MFYSFEEKNEKWGTKSTSFIEIQYCKLNPKTPLKKIVSVNEVEGWKNDSLYVATGDMDEFNENYKDIFCDGVYNNLKRGVVDFFGINYYSPEQLREMIRKIQEQKPLHYEVLLEWLKEGLNYNGIYILGL